jgi:multidrug efflux pump subunit AcrA (membrane-fusion protein)
MQPLVVKRARWGLILWLTTAAACRTSGEPSAEMDRQPVVTVAIDAARVRERRDVVVAGGVLRGREHATISARVMAPVVAVPVKAGDHVKAGHLLVRLDARDVSAETRQRAAAIAAAERRMARAAADRDGATAALALARATHARIAQLHERRSATPQELDEVVASVRQADARLATAEAAVGEAAAGLEAARAAHDAADVSLSFTVVTAPFDGVVTETLIEPGMLAAPGTPLVKLENTRSLDLEIKLDESRAAWLDSEMPIRVAIDRPEGSIEHAGELIEVARASDADARAVLVTFRLPADARLRPGMYARAELPGPERRALAVPDGAIIRRGQLASVFVVEDGVARTRLVHSGRSAGGFTEVLAGVVDGEIVVVDPAAALTDGTRVAPRPSSGSAGPVAPAVGGAR